MFTTTARYVICPRRVTGWYVSDAETGAGWTGLTRVGALSLADHLNARAAAQPVQPDLFT